MDALLNILIAGISALGLWVLYLFGGIVLALLTRPFTKLGVLFLKHIYNSHFLLMTVGYLIVGLNIYVMYLVTEYFHVAELDDASASFIFISFGISITVSVLFLIGLDSAKLEKPKPMKSLKDDAIGATSKAMLKKTGSEVKDDVMDWFD